jgi:hypothetical protein
MLLNPWGYRYKVKTLTIYSEIFGYTIKKTLKDNTSIMEWDLTVRRSEEE